ncbi:hypothetical protein SH528x_005468 [Novipirellula sp. SH528]|uniref:golvesin C-terminal-like domain-containing protein n=1 Tax=Novipirellula sp. SH528 TaxID=3454466 RepID=UPI003F9F1B15
MRLLFESLEDRRVLASVVSVSPSLDNGVLAAGSTSLQIAFSEPVVGGDVASNFELRNQGADGILGNADDGLASLSAAYSANTTTLNFAGLDEGVFRLTVKDSITDVASNPLDGDHDGLAGGDDRRDVVVGGIDSQSPTILLPSIKFGQQGSQFGTSVAIDGDLRVVGAPNADLDGFTDVGVVYVYSATTGALVATLSNPTPESSDKFANSVAVSGNTVVVGAQFDNTGASSSGSAYVFNATTGALLATLTNPTPSTNGFFGVDVAVSGNTVVVGASSSGSAYVFNATTGALLATLANPTPATNDYFGASVAVSGNTVVVGALGDDTGASNSGSAYVFNATNGALLATLASPTPETNDSFGISVAVSDNTVVVGAYRDDTGASDSGSAYVFNATTGALLATLDNPTPESTDWFGRSVAVSGNTIVVGAYQDDTGAFDSGSAYVFNATTGALLATLTNPTPEGSDFFGSSVAISGNTVVVGAYRDNSGGSGGAYVFNASTGALLATLANPTPASGDWFGSSVAVSGNTVVVGAHLDDTGAINNGSAYVFNAATGTLLATLANPTAGVDYFGSSVAVSGNTVVVGALQDNTGAFFSGSAYVFNATTGVLLATLANPTPASRDHFGVSVSVSGNTVVVGAYRDDTGASDSGSAYVFNATTGALLTTLANPTPSSGDNFGYSVAVSGNTVVVGAFLDDTGSSDSGSAYLFNATTGALLATLDNPTPASGDNFGYNVAVSGNTVVVGAQYDDTGASDSGSAYVFNATTGALLATLENPTPESSDQFGSSVAVSGNTVVVGAQYDDTGASDSGSAYVFNATTGALLATLENLAPASTDYFGNSVAVSGNNVVVGAYLDDTQNTDQGASYVFALDANQELLSASGQMFDVDASSFGTGQLIQGTNNAFDGLNRLQVDNVDYATLSSQSTTTDDNGRTVVTPQVTMSGLSVSREITVPNTMSQDFARTIEVVTNATGSPITVPVRIVGNLGSDSNTTVFATSDGDAIVEPTDTWFGTDDGDGVGTPAVIHLLHGAFGLQPSSVNVIDDNVEWTYNLTVDSGETQRVASFTVLGTTRQQAIDAANALVTSSGFGGEAAAFLTPSDVASLVNFDFNVAPTDIELSANSIKDNNAVNAVVGTLSTLDTNLADGDTFTYSLVPGAGDTNNIRFTIDGDLLKAAAVFEYETQASYSIRIRATDSLGAFVDKPFTIQVVDSVIELDTENTATTTLVGGWNPSVSVPGFEGANYVHTPPGSNSTATFTPALGLAGQYEVFVKYSSHANRASNVKVSVTHAAGTFVVLQNQKTGGGVFHSLGLFNFEAGTAGYLTLDAAGSDGYVTADAVQFSYIGDVVAAPSADLAGPISGQSLTADALNANGFIDVTFNSMAGLDGATVLDAGGEFTLSGSGVGTAVVNGAGVLQSGTTYRYSFTGSFVPGSVNVNFTADAFANTTASGNLAEQESFALTDGAVRITLDNSDATQVNNWTVSTSTVGYVGPNYLYTNAGGAGRLVYTPTIPSDGSYEVFINYTDGSSRASNAAYEVVSQNGTSVVRVDQRTGGGVYQSLGTFNFLAGTAGSVTLRGSDADGFVVGDAVQFVRVGNTTGAPTATLADPIAGASIVVTAINGRDYVDVTFSDTSGVGLDVSTITDSEEEFTLGGAGASAVTVDGAATLVLGTTYRYATTGDFAPGAVDAVFAAGTFADSMGNANIDSIASFVIAEDVQEEVIVDNSGPGFTVNDPSSQFFSSSSLGGFVGPNYIAAPTGSTATATWTPTLANSGQQYQVYVRYTSHELRATNATYAVTHDGGATSVVIDQTSGGGTWVLLGSFVLSDGSASVRLLSAGANQYVVADAVRFVLL